MLHIVLLLHSFSLRYEACRPKDEGHVRGGLDMLLLFQIHHRLILVHHIVNLNLEVLEPKEGELIRLELVIHLIFQVHHQLTLAHYLSRILILDMWRFHPHHLQYHLLHHHRNHLTLIQFRGGNSYSQC